MRKKQMTRKMTIATAQPAAPAMIAAGGLGLPFEAELPLRLILEVQKNGATRTSYSFVKNRRLMQMATLSRHRQCKG
jgi:hypothetical protein